MCCILPYCWYFTDAESSGGSLLLCNLSPSPASLPFVSVCMLFAISGTSQIRCFLDAPLVIFFRRLTQAQHKMQFDWDKPSNLANLWKFHRRFHSLSNSFNIFWCCFSKSNLPSWYRLLFWFVDTEPQNDSNTVSALAETVIFISTCNHHSAQFWVMEQHQGSSESPTGPYSMAVFLGARSRTWVRLLLLLRLLPLRVVQLEQGKGFAMVHTHVIQMCCNSHRWHRFSTSVCTWRPAKQQDAVSSFGAPCLGQREWVACNPALAC